MMQASCTNGQQCVLIWEVSWRGTIQKKPGTARATDRDSTSSGKWSMGRLLRIYPLRKTLRRIKTETSGRYSGVVCPRTTYRVPVPMMFVRGGQEGRDALASICEASLVDITLTILDILGLLPSFNTALQNRPDAVKGGTSVLRQSPFAYPEHPTSAFYLQRAQ